MKPTAKTRKTTARFVPSFVSLEDRAVPATLFVDPTLTGADGSGGTWNGTTQVTIGQNGFRTLAAAVAKAVATTETDDIINLSAGTHPVSNQDGTTPPLNGSAPIPTSVNIVGISPTSTRLVPVGNTADGITALLAASGTGSKVNFSNLTVDGKGFNIGVGIQYLAGTQGTVSNVQVINVAFQSSVGTGIAATDAGPVVVTGSTITSFGSVGVSFDVSGTAATPSAVTNSIITGNQSKNNLNYGIQVIDGSNVIITGNNLSGFTGVTTGGAPSGDDFPSAAVAIDSTSSSVATVSAFANAISNTNTGFLTGGASTGTDLSNVELGINNFDTVTIPASRDFTPVDQKTQSEFDFFDTTNPRDASGSVVFTRPSGTANPLLDANGQPFTSLRQALLATRPSLFYFAASAGAGGGQTIKQYDASGAEKATVNSPIAGTGGARVVLADVDGDGTVDTIIGSGVGTAARIVVIAGNGGGTLADFAPFESSFQGGVVLAAGDFNLDGFSDVVATADDGGSQRVSVFDGKSMKAQASSPTVLANYAGLASVLGTFDDPGFRGGTRPGVGDVNGDGVPDVLIAAGIGGGPRITIWDGNAVADGRLLNKSNGTVAADANGKSAVLANFFAFEENLRNGASVSAGDLTGDNSADLIFGGGPGGSPRVRVADAAQVLGDAALVTLDKSPSFTIANYTAGDGNARGGVRVLGRDVDADGVADIITGSGTNLSTNGEVRLYTGAAIVAAPNSPDVQQTIDPFGAAIPGGVFVG